jgi:hypothetical protein
MSTRHAAAFVELQFTSKMFVFRVPQAQVARRRLAPRLLRKSLTHVIGCVPSLTMFTFSDIA